MHLVYSAPGAEALPSSGDAGGGAAQRDAPRSRRCRGARAPHCSPAGGRCSPPAGASAEPEGAARPAAASRDNVWRARWRQVARPIPFIHSFPAGLGGRWAAGAGTRFGPSTFFFFFFFFIPAVLSPLEAQLSTAGLSFSPVHATRHMPECGSAGGGLRVQRSAPPELSPVPARRPRTRARAIPATPRQGPGAAVPRRRRNGRDGAAAPRGRVSAAAAGLGHRAGLLSN